MLARLVRYAVRHRHKLAAVPSRSESMRCLRALGLERDARHDAWQKIRTIVEKALRRRRWLGR